jgi:signal transduction histidine kinase
MNSPEYGEEDRMTTVAAKPAAPGSWWLALLGGLAGQTARVAEADRARAALLATVSHDLRAPLAAAKAAVSGLRADDARLTTDDRADLLAAAEESLDRLAHLAASLLDVSRLQAGARAGRRSGRGGPGRRWSPHARGRPRGFSMRSSHGLCGNSICLALTDIRRCSRIKRPYQK